MLSVEHIPSSIVKIQLRGFIRRLSGSRFLLEPAAAGIVAPIDCKRARCSFLYFHTQSEIAWQLAYAAVDWTVAWYGINGVSPPVERCSEVQACRTKISKMNLTVCVKKTRP